MSAQALHLKFKFLTPTQVVFFGEVVSVAAENEEGKFSILPNHANFISVVTGDVIVRQKDSQKLKTLDVQHGIVHCKNNEVSVFGGLTELAR
jgi:F0F1-type ATP synthase epsilon subunit